MTFKQAQIFVMPYGKYVGRTIDDVAGTDEGLRYLDWMRGLDDIKNRALRQALDAYFADETIQKEMDTLKEDER